MKVESDGRRAGKRYRKKLTVEVHSKVEGKNSLAQALDVSRHGLFVAMSHPPKENHVVLLTVHLPDAPFETMGLVARRIIDEGKRNGAGVKLYCLASDAKARWDHFIDSIAGGSEYALAPRPSLASADACFMVQLESVEEIEAFFNKHVRPGNVVHVTPPVKRIGARIEVVLVHPESHVEFVLRALVAELYPERPSRMGIRFVDVDMAKRIEFRRFLGIDAPPEGQHNGAERPELVAQPRQRFTEYAFYSPKIVHTPEGIFDEKSMDEELQIVEGQLLDLEELELVDTKRMFDFNWNAEVKK